MNYKDTLNILKTDFDMRAGLATKEPIMQTKWNELDLYNKMQEKNAGKDVYMFHDGPPYANGSIHCGHALNKIIKDVIVRSKQFQGFSAPFIPGWDTHGLPIENAMLKDSGLDRKTINPVDLRKMCAEYAMQQVSNQAEQFKRLGINMDYAHPYLTLHKEYEAEQIRVFATMVEKGYIFKALKPVYWSPSSESALAEAEIEYAEKTSPSIYVAFSVKDGKDALEKDDKVIIWTTTPWTLPANVGVSVNAEFDYIKFSYDGSNYVVLKEFLDDLLETFEFDKEQVVEIETIKGAKFEHCVLTNPWDKRDSLMILGDHVTNEAGTGFVHTAPGHGEDDFIVGKKYNLEVLSPIDNKGHFTDEEPTLAGMYYEDANKVVGQKLDEEGALLKLKFIKHQYAHDWRTKKPVMYRATPQWFASINMFKEEILEALESVNFKTDWGRTRLENMIKNREDWCISRQRIWGVPIPIFYNEDGSEIVDKDVIEHVAQLFEENGSDIWYAWDVKDLLPEGYTNPASPNGDFTKETDIMDVWFDSGTSHAGVIKKRFGLKQSDVYFEGSDQYRGWFNSSLITGVAVNNVAPFKTLVSAGFVLDEKGEKMSKSIGNVVDPLIMCDQYGADILRLWVAMADYENDIRIGDSIMNTAADNYRKIRNSMRFMISNLEDFELEVNGTKEFTKYDLYMLEKLASLNNKIINAYNTFEYAHAFRMLLDYLANDLSAEYFDYAKDILYVASKDDAKRRAIQTVMHKHLNVINLLIAPFLIHTSEEIFWYCNGEESSIHLQEWSILEEAKNDDLKQLFDNYHNVRSVVNKEIEIARENKLIKKSLECKITISADKDIIEKLENLEINLEQLFLVSKVDLEVAETLTAKVEKYEGHTCPRCLHVFEQLDGETCSSCKTILGA